MCINMLSLWKYRESLIQSNKDPKEVYNDVICQYKNLIQDTLDVGTCCDSDYYGLYYNPDATQMINYYEIPCVYGDKATRLPWFVDRWIFRDDEKYHSAFFPYMAIYCVLTLDKGFVWIV